MARKLILKSFLSPGDLCTLTAAVESLHASYPNQFMTDVRTSCNDLFRGNPHITSLSDGEAEVLEMHYTDLIGRSDDVSNPFLRGYCYDLGKKLGLPLELVTNRPCLYLTPDEQSGYPLTPFGVPGAQRYWLVTAGTKTDFTLKQWPVEYFQAVVDHFRGAVQFVQVGAREHDHPKLEGVIDLVGKTDIRQLMRLAHHADGGLGPVTLLQHLCAAFEKPYVALLGGREPVAWTQYPVQTTLHTMGRLPCCQRRACWRSRVVALNDGAEADKSLCALPVLEFQKPVGKCMAMIGPEAVIAAVNQYHANAAFVVSRPAKRAAASACPVLPQEREEPEVHPHELVAHSAWGFHAKIVPAGTARPWMDATGERFAYHCLPMVLANQSGWLILAPHGVVATWNGGMAPQDLNVEIVGTPPAVQAMTQVGSGILTWMIPYIFRTPPGWNLLCRGPANAVKDGVFPLEGLVETDWSFASFSMNWKFTRPGRVEFKEGEPIAMLVPHRRSDLEAFSTRYADLGEAPQLQEGYNAWIGDRHKFWEAQKRGEAAVLKQKFQKHYFRGCTNAGLFFPEHQKARKLSAFTGPKASSAPSHQIAQEPPRQNSDAPWCVYVQGLPFAGTRLVRDLCGAGFVDGEIVLRDGAGQRPPFDVLVEAVRERASRRPDRLWIAARNGYDETMTRERLRANPEVAVLWMLRHPYDILLSEGVADPRGSHLPQTLLAGLRLFVEFRLEPQVVPVRYEDLVADADAVQRTLAATLRIKAGRGFRTALAERSVARRPKPRGPFWKQAPHSEVIRDLTEQFPELPELGRLCGYDMQV